MQKINADLLFAKTPLIINEDTAVWLQTNSIPLLHQLWRLQRIYGRAVKINELQSSLGLTKADVMRVLKTAAQISSKMDDKTSSFYYRKLSKAANWRVKSKADTYWIEYQTGMKAARGYNENIWPASAKKYARLATGVGVEVVDTRSALERLMSANVSV